MLNLPSDISLISNSEGPVKPPLEPIFTTDLAETLGIRKFLEMSIADLETQVRAAARDPRTPAKHFSQVKANAVVITAWLVSALEMVDGMLAQAKAASPEPLADQQRGFT